MSALPTRTTWRQAPEPPDFNIFLIRELADWLAARVAAGATQVLASDFK